MPREQEEVPNQQQVLGERLREFRETLLGGHASSRAGVPAGAGRAKVQFVATVSYLSDTLGTSLTGKGRLTSLSSSVSISQTEAVTATGAAVNEV